MYASGVQSKGKLAWVRFKKERVGIVTQLSLEAEPHEQSSGEIWMNEERILMTLLYKQ